MSQYIKSPFKPSPQLAVAGTPSYLLGSYNDRTSPTLGFVISDSAVTTTGTLTFQITSGLPPIVGALITVVGTANASGNFNVTNAAILTVVTNTTTGVCSVTYAITSSTVAANTPDAGQVIVPQTEVGEAVGSGTVPYASVPVARPFNNPEMQEGQSLTATLNMSAGLSGVAAVLQGADIDLDSEYQPIHTFGTSGLSTFQSGQDTPAAAGNSNPGGAPVLNYRFYRFNISAATGSGTVIGKIEF
jgi:hypothetical protein